MTEKELILTSILGLSRSELYLESIILNETEKNRFESLIEKRKNGEPLQYLLGYTEFMGLKFKVDSRALIPRPETEILVEETINCVKELNYSVRNVLDIGTGSGNISVSVAKLLTQTEITAIDICTEALGLARENAILNKVDHRVEFINGDFLNNWQLIKKSNFYPPSQKTTSLPADECEEKVASAGFSLMDKPETSQRITPTSMPKLSKKILAYLTSRGNIDTTGLPREMRSISGTKSPKFLRNFRGPVGFYDIIISNPPYIRTPDLEKLPADVQQEPKIALDGGSDGLEFYPAIIQKASKLLKVKGMLALEIGHNQSKSIIEMLVKEKFNIFKIVRDYANIERVIIANLN